MSLSNGELLGVRKILPECHEVNPNSFAVKLQNELAARFLHQVILLGPSLFDARLLAVRSTWINGHSQRRVLKKAIRLPCPKRRMGRRAYFLLNRFGQF